MTDNYRAERAGRAEIGIGFVLYTVLSHLLSVYYLDIIEPLVDMWSHGSVLQVIKDHLVIFKLRVRISLVYGVQVSHILNINLDFATDCGVDNMWHLLSTEDDMGSFQDTCHKKGACSTLLDQIYYSFGVNFKLCIHWECEGPDQGTDGPSMAVSVSGP